MSKNVYSVRFLTKVSSLALNAQLDSLATQKTQLVIQHAPQECILWQANRLASLAQLDLCALIQRAWQSQNVLMDHSQFQVTSNV